MDFGYSENQTMLAARIERFLTACHDLPRRKALLEDRAASDALWREMAELGWIGAAFPQSAGGFAESALDTFVVMEGLGRHLVALPYLTSVILCGGLIASRPDLIEAMVAGRLNLALVACGNAPLHSPQFGAISVARRGREHVLSGRMAVVIGGDRADKFLVEAAGNLYLVDADRVARHISASRAGMGHGQGHCTGLLTGHRHGQPLAGPGSLSAGTSHPLGRWLSR